MSIPLCYRCEYRAAYNETGHGPRCECQDVNTAVVSCYMYRPPRPLVISPNKGEDRPLHIGAAFSGRGHAVKIADGKYSARIQDGEYATYFIPDGEDVIQ